MARPASPRNKRYPPVRVLWRLLANEALCEQLRDRAGRSLRPTERGDVYPIGRAGSGGGSLRALLADHPMPVPGEKFHPGQGLLPRAQNLFPIIRAIRQFFGCGISCVLSGRSTRSVMDMPRRLRRSGRLSSWPALARTHFISRGHPRNLINPQWPAIVNRDSVHSQF
jgi:hypothetical protein